MRPVVWTFAAVFVFGMVTLQGCGDDDESPVLDSVSSSKKISDVTDEEAYEMCVDVSEALSERMNALGKETLCMIGGVEARNESVTGMTPEQTCQAAYDFCMNMKLEQIIAQMDMDLLCQQEEGASDEFAGCDATVGELDKCFRDTLNGMEDMVSNLSCKTEELVDPEDPASCEALDDECPDFMGDDTVTDDEGGAGGF